MADVPYHIENVDDLKRLLSDQEIYENLNWGKYDTRIKHSHRYRFGPPNPRRRMVPRSTYGGWVIKENGVGPTGIPDDQSQLHIVRVAEPPGTQAERLTRLTPSGLIVHTFARKGHIVWKSRREVRLEKKRIISQLKLSNDLQYDGDYDSPYY